MQVRCWFWRPIATARSLHRCTDAGRARATERAAHRLNGLTRGRHGAFAGQSGPVDALRRRLVRQVHGRTDGNPFFVTEMARLDSRDSLAIPDNVRMAIARRLDRLSELANRTLVVAAVIGREFDFPLLRAALPDAGDEALLRPSTRR